MVDNIDTVAARFRTATGNLERNIYNECFIEFTKGMQHTRRIVHKITRKLEHSYTVSGNGTNQITFGSTSPYARTEEITRGHHHFQPGLDLATKGIPSAIIRAMQKSFS